MNRNRFKANILGAHKAQDQCQGGCLGESKAREAGFSPCSETKIAAMMLKIDHPSDRVLTAGRGELLIIANFSRGWEQRRGCSLQSSQSTLMIANKPSLPSSTRPAERLSLTITDAVCLWRVRLQTWVQAEPKSIVSVCRYLFRCIRVQMCAKEETKGWD